MTIDEKKAKCTEFFEKLSEALKEDYVVMGSCNQDFSRYLVPIGTESQVSYMGKPENSFRISDHWNWFANVNKCPDEHYIQCLSVDLPWTRKRFAPGKPSRPVSGTQVAVFGADRKYHAVYGERYSRKTKTWDWVESTVEEVIAIVKGEK